MIKKTAFIIYFLFCSIVAPVYSELQSAKIDSTTRNVAGKVIDSMFKDIHLASKRIKKLKQFSNKNVLENKYGMRLIEFLEVPEYNFDREPLAFAINIVPIDVKNVFDKHLKSYHFTFPYLGVKIVAYQEGATPQRRFDLFKMIQKHGLLLIDHQQNYMPFRMSIISERKVYKIGEKIRFKVKLINASNMNLRIYKITRKSLYVTINENVWGNPKGERRQYSNEITLRPGQVIEKNFDIGPYQYPQKIEIYGIYHMVFEGINPSAILNLNVVD